MTPRDPRVEPKKGDRVQWIGQVEMREVVAVIDERVTFDVIRRSKVVHQRTVSLGMWRAVGPQMQVVHVAEEGAPNA